MTSLSRPGVGGGGPGGALGSAADVETLPLLAGCVEFLDAGDPGWPSASLDISYTFGSGSAWEFRAFFDARRLKCFCKTDRYELTKRIHNHIPLFYIVAL